VRLPRFVGHKAYSRSIRSLLDQRPDPHHAYRFARRCSELRHGTAGMVAQNSQTLREGLDLGLRYARPELGNSERLVVRVEKKEMVVLMSPPDPRIDFDYGVDCFNAIVMLLGHELRGRRLPPGMTVSFDAPHCELVLRSDYLDTPLLSPSTELQAIALRQLEGSDPSANISDRVRAVFQTLEPDVPDLDEVCEALHMSRATPEGLRTYLGIPRLRSRRSPTSCDLATRAVSRKPSDAGRGSRRESGASLTLLCARLDLTSISSALCANSLHTIA